MPVSHPFCCLSNKSTNKALCLSLTKICEVGGKWRKFIFLLCLAIVSWRSFRGLILQNPCRRKQRICSNSYIEKCGFCFSQYFSPFYSYAVFIPVWVFSRVTCFMAISSFCSFSPNQTHLLLQDLFKYWHIHLFQLLQASVINYPSSLTPTKTYSCSYSMPPLITNPIPWN